MKKTKVLIIQARITPYRVPVFNRLAQEVDLTVIYERGAVPEGAKFSTKKVDVLKLPHVKTIHKINVLSYTKAFDVVIMMLDTSYMTTHLLARIRRHTAFVVWGIGVAAARNMRYDGSQEIVEQFSKIIRHADAALFYSDYPIDKYVGMGIPREKMFVAHNTVEVLPTIDRERTDILFVGTLYKAKKIFELLENYHRAFQKNPHVPALTIVGDGEDYQAVKEWIDVHGLTERITLTGAVFEEPILAEYFSRALMCISPDQAGLSVLKSFGYGVPFVTNKDAITGGERLNIVHGENGVLIESFDELENLILDCAEHRERYIAMGQVAQKHYYENRTVNGMVNGFLQVIKFVTDQNKNR